MFLVRRVVPVTTIRTMSSAAAAATAPAPGDPSSALDKAHDVTASTVDTKREKTDAVDKRIYEGVFAVNKPEGISSAQVIRELQTVFKPSKLFAPWFVEERRRMTAEANRPSQHPRAKRKILNKANNLEVKLGHGGTLDPMATGVLVLGLGRGTKSLQSYSTSSDKSYDTTLLFGVATDTYDLSGKLMARAAYGHVTRDKVEKALAQFRGDEISQLPPIYSALKMDGKPLYEYAREGKELPRAIERRVVGVKRLEITEWLEPEQHQYKWPEEEAPIEQRKQASKLLQLEEAPGVEVREITATAVPDIGDTGSKRKHESVDDGGSSKSTTDAVSTEPVSKKVRETNDGTENAVAPSLSSSEPATTGTDTEPYSSTQGNSQTQPHAIESSETTAEPTTSSPSVPNPPAVQLEMTVTSGFYVRSLCHDLGRAVGSLGAMATLVRTRQAGYELGTPRVIEYNDIIGKDEAEWGPKVRDALAGWMAEQGRDE